MDGGSPPLERIGRTRRRPAATVAAAFVFTALFLGPAASGPAAAATGEWGDLVLFNDTASFYPGSVELDAHGNALLVGTADGSCGSKVLAKVAAAGEDWSEPTLLYEEGCPAPSGNVVGPFLRAAFVDGRAAVLLNRYNGSEQLAIAFFDFDGGWSPLRPVEANGTGRLIGPSFALGPDGTATVAWAEGYGYDSYYGYSNIDLYARRLDADGAQGGLIVLENSSWFSGSCCGGMSRAPDGSTLLAWSFEEKTGVRYWVECQRLGCPYEIHAGRIAPNGSVTETVFRETIKYAGCTGMGFVANAAGYQILTMVDTGSRVSWMRIATPDGVWSNASAVSDMCVTGAHGSEGGWTGMTIDGNGTVNVLSLRWNINNWVAHFAQRKPLGQPWEDKIELGNESGEFPGSGALATALDGSSVAAWGTRLPYDPEGSFVPGGAFTAVAMDANGTWGTPISLNVTPENRTPRWWDASVDEGGGARVLWAADNETGSTDRVWMLRLGGDVATSPRLVLGETPTVVTSSDPAFEITGSVDPGTRVWVNGTEVTVAANGSFSAVVMLSVGLNTIEVVATDARGNSITEEIQIERVEPPAPPPPEPDPPVTPPTTDPPITDPPITDPPALDPPTPDPPIADPPISDPPIPDPPVATPPIVDPPASTPPVGEPPISDPPVTTPPVTAPSPSGSTLPPPPVSVLPDASLSSLWALAAVAAAAGAVLWARSRGPRQSM